MRDFINKLELAFDKKLDKTNYGRNQVKELFLRACIEVLADNSVGETPSKEEDDELTNPNYPPKASILRYNSFAFNEVEDALFVQYRKAPGYDNYMFEVYGHDMELLVEGWTSIDNPSEEDMIQLYLFYEDQLPF